MYSKFPLSLETIPRHRLGCYSLKFSTIVTAIIVILYSLLTISTAFAALSGFKPAVEDPEAQWQRGLVIFVIVLNAITFILTALMLIGALSDKPAMIRPWIVWKSVQLVVAVLLFVFWNTLAMFSQYADTSVMLCAVQFLTIMVRFYMLVLVTSFYKQLMEERNETERLKNLVNSEAWYGAEV